MEYYGAGVCTESSIPRERMCRKHALTARSRSGAERQLTLLTGFSRVFTDTSAGFPFLDGVLLILGEWNLSISFMVKEER